MVSSLAWAAVAVCPSDVDGFAFPESPVGEEPDHVDGVLGVDLAMVQGSLNHPQKLLL